MGGDVVVSRCQGFVNGFVSGVLPAYNNALTHARKQQTSINCDLAVAQTNQTSVTHAYRQGQA